MHICTLNYNVTRYLFYIFKDLQKFLILYKYINKNFRFNRVKYILDMGIFLEK